MTPGNNLEPAEKTYESFIGVVKWGVVGVAALVILVITLITRG